MALLKAALVPHSPLLIPEIGRANYSFLGKTLDAYQQVGENLKAKEIETLIIISPHGLAPEKIFTLNIAPEIKINLKDFGFIPPKTTLAGDVLLADQLKEALKADFSLQLVSTLELDYGSAIPAYLLKNLVGDFKIIVISPAADLPLEDYYNFGVKIKAVLESSDKKIAVIASGDLSHRLKRKSPAGYSPKGAKFDNKLIEYLSDFASAKDNILKMDSKLIKDAGECGLKPILVLLGILDEVKAETKVLAYQTDFGIGYLSLDFKF